MLHKILFVATYEGMFQTAHRVAKSKESGMDIISGELFEAVKKAEQCNMSNKEVIVSRGGTARLLRKFFKLPVVEVEVCAYDILRAVYKYRDRRIAVIGADNVISGVKVLQKVIGLDIQYFPFTFEDEIMAKVDMARSMNIDVVVGDTVAVRIAKSKGLAVELVTSGKESVADAIDRAEKICSAILQEREKSSRINAIVEHLNEGIIVTDQNLKIVLFNRVAENLFQKNRQEIIDSDVSLILPMIDIQSVLKSGYGSSGQIIKSKNKYLVASTFPVWVGEECKGVAVTCEDVTDIQELEQRIRRTLSKRGLLAKCRFEDIIGVSPEIQGAINLSKKYAPVDSTVFIYGESGTGKELFAQSIHNHSNRKNGPFIAINCANLPSNLLESTLFGYVEGAFAGARRGGKKGVFEIAHNGTLFLDEIAEFDLSIQSKLLRFLQEHEVMRLGADSIIPVNVRIITASNKNLLEAVRANMFREDLYYRISVLNINIPPLRERIQDVPPLTLHFIEKYCHKYKLPPLKIEGDVICRMMMHSWPGNVRQLENMVQKIVLLSEDGVFGNKAMDHFLIESTPPQEDQSIFDYSGTLMQITRDIIMQVLKEEQFNKTKTAERLDITRVTLNKYLNI